MRGLWLVAIAAACGVSTAAVPDVVGYNFTTNGTLTGQSFTGTVGQSVNVSVGWLGGSPQVNFVAPRGGGIPPVGWSFTAIGDNLGAGDAFGGTAGVVGRQMTFAGQRGSIN